MRATGQHVGYACPHPGCDGAVEVHGTIYPAELGVPAHGEAERVEPCGEGHAPTADQESELRERYEGGDALEWAEGR